MAAFKPITAKNSNDAYITMMHPIPMNFPITISVLETGFEATEYIIPLSTSEDILPEDVSITKRDTINPAK